jgi:hypothetical protein
MASTEISRRRWRFSLRALLLAMALAAIPLGLLAHWISAKHREHEAARTVLNRGGSVSYFTNRDVRYRGWRLRGLSLILPKDCFYTVHGISFSKAGDDELSLLPSMPQIAEINLEGCQFTNKGLRHFGTLKKLTFLELSSSQLNDEGFQHILPHQGLTQLWLEDTQLTDASLPRVALNRGLTHLNLSGTGVTDQGCSHLAGLPELKVLALRATGITNDVVTTLEQLPSLQYLYLMRTPLDDDAVAGLSQLKLRQLDIRFTQISADGYERLKQALSNCTIEWLPPK